MVRTVRSEMSFRGSDRFDDPPPLPNQPKPTPEKWGQSRCAYPPKGVAVRLLEVRFPEDVFRRFRPTRSVPQSLTEWLIPHFQSWREIWPLDHNFIFQRLRGSRSGIVAVSVRATTQDWFASRREAQARDMLPGDLLYQTVEKQILGACVK